MDSLQVAGFLEHSTVNGEGFRSTLFLSGCFHDCKGCHNSAMQNTSYGEKISIKQLADRIKKNVPLIDGITISGGEPLLQIRGLIQLLESIKPLNLSIWVYTGYTLEQALTLQGIDQLLPLIDVLVDGKYQEHLHTDTLKYIGSSNQRIIRLQNGEFHQVLTY